MGYRTEYFKHLPQKILASVFTLSLFTSGCGAASLPTVSEPSILRQKTLSSRDAALFFTHVADRIAREYVDQIDNNQLLEGALNGMLQSLDPHSAYLDPKKFQEIQKQTQGEYGGLGMEMTMDEGVVKIVSSIEDTPAFKAGLMTGDLIIMINDDPVYGMSIIEASEKLKGEPHTKVRIMVRRGNKAPFVVELTREIIKVQPVKWKIEGNVGYLRISTFIETTTQELKKAIQQIQKKLGPQLTGLLIDVRNNAGGLLDQGVAVTELFVDGGDIVSIRGRDPGKDFFFKSAKGDIVHGLPIVVLINGGSASASEILAGALQDRERALIVGTKSWGKGSVQTVFPMTNGGALKLTTALYYTPAGRSIQKTGIIPDIEIEQQIDIKTINEDKRYREANLQKALEQGKHRKSNSGSSNGTSRTKEESKPLTVAPTSQEAEKKPVGDAMRDAVAQEDDVLKEMHDYQLTQALNILRAIALQKKVRNPR